MWGDPAPALARLAGAGYAASHIAPATPKDGARSRAGDRRLALRQTPWPRSDKLLLEEHFTAFKRSHSVSKRG
jgi:hypothetical protein